MPATLDAESTLTDRYQTTVPETVRRALRLGKPRGRSRSRGMDAFQGGRGKKIPTG
jgi:hypothetical protein